MLMLLLTALIAHAAPKLSCNAKELQRRDCRLIQANYNLRLLDKTVAWNDGTWHTVEPMPLSGEGVSWEKINFEIMNGQPVLQMWLWDKGVGEAQVQSLHWFVADAERRKFTILAQGVVRKRRLKEPLTGAEANGAPAAAAAKKPKYLFDAWETHGLKKLKNGTLEWTLGREKKILEKANLEKAKHGI